MTCSKPIRIVAALLIFGALACTSVRAQAIYDCFYVKPTKLAHIRGIVVDPQGAPIPAAKIDLLRKGNEDPISNLQTDATGAFQFDEPSGFYLVHVQASGFHAAGLNVRVSHGIFSFFNTRRLYVVLTVGGIPQPCPAEITSKRKLQEYIRDNATQK